ncbi:MAG: hypothetical protein Fur0017_14630 [Anaerolineales bacterium]
MNRLVLLAGLIVMAGCTSQNTPPPPAPTIVPTIQAIPTPTPIPPTPTPVKVSVQVAAELANCRFGPGTVYMTMNEIRSGRLLTAVGRNDTSTWWMVEDPINPGGVCWVAAEVTEARGDVSQLAIVPAPFVSITKVNLRVEPNRILVKCSDFPQTVFFEAAITANGPTLLTWQWEASTGVTSDVGTLIYEQSGTQVINEFYRINAPNEYWVKLKILTPNEVVEQVTFPVSCNP